MKISLLLICFFLVGEAHAVTQAECVQAARDFNDHSKGIKFGLDISRTSPSLVASKARGYHATMKERANAARVVRLCLSTSLGNSFGKMNTGEGKALFCQVQDLDDMSGPCDENARPVKFKAF